MTFTCCGPKGSAITCLGDPPGISPSVWVCCRCRCCRPIVAVDRAGNEDRRVKGETFDALNEMAENRALSLLLTNIL